MSKYPGLKKIFSTTDEMMAQHVCSLLVNQGFKADVKNISLTDIAVPRILAPLEVWIEESSFLEAQEMLKRALAQSESNEPPWVCSQCNETAESQFTECWSCGTSRQA